PAQGSIAPPWPPSAADSPPAEALPPELVAPPVPLGSGSVGCSAQMRSMGVSVHATASAARPQRVPREPHLPCPLFERSPWSAPLGHPGCCSRASLDSVTLFEHCARSTRPLVLPRDSRVTSADRSGPPAESSVRTTRSPYTTFDPPETKLRSDN